MLARGCETYLSPLPTGDGKRQIPAVGERRETESNCPPAPGAFLTPEQDVKLFVSQTVLIFSMKTFRHSYRQLPFFLTKMRH